MPVFEFTLIVLGAALIVGAGVLRRDSLLTVAMTTGGFLTLMVALFWSQDLEPDGVPLVLLGAIGGSLAVMGTERSRREKRDRSAESNEPVRRT
jgi:hypothetical protein